ncbi:hypothetical protein C900_03382 [Fulvivirga imtechensis AK7]|uniref:Type cbb3 cytochrome oxidase biogenesis protein CcoS, involved in heme b insertion n=1 Tax=Fulvivirga imtechensis AK7 TaxID=1237149 RepID=L8JTF4_9BACT|nr:cbb3-type cytochrome oxidase assembly protein CcoS [Fulvivirga imtechensis]ELR70774.1 hypothetical protein C900_03382 [Fulvivirga imtechensis AK7]
MSVIFVLIIVSMVVAGGFLALFIWANKSGQFDDTVTPSMRMLFDDKKKRGTENTSQQAEATHHNRDD